MYVCMFVCMYVYMYLHVRIIFVFYPGLPHIALRSYMSLKPTHYKMYVLGRCLVSQIYMYIHVHVLWDVFMLDRYSCTVRSIVILNSVS